MKKKMVVNPLILKKQSNEESEKFTSINRTRKQKHAKRQWRNIIGQTLIFNIKYAQYQFQMCDYIAKEILHYTTTLSSKHMIS